METRADGQERRRPFSPGWATDQLLDEIDREEEQLEAHFRRVRAAALAETSAAFTACGPGGQQVVQAMAVRMARRTDGGCLIRPRPGSPSALPVAADHVQPHSQQLLAALVRAYPTALGSAYSDWVMDHGRPLLTRQVSMNSLRGWTRQPAWSYLEHCDIVSFLVVPVQAAGRIVGTLTVWRERPGRALDEDDQVFAVEVGRRLVTA
jgi:GAF domain-containing protein